MKRNEEQESVKEANKRQKGEVKGEDGTIKESGETEVKETVKRGRGRKQQTEKTKDQGQKPKPANDQEGEENTERKQLYPATSDTPQKGTKGAPKEKSTKKGKGKEKAVKDGAKTGTGGAGEGAEGEENNEAEAADGQSFVPILPTEMPSSYSYPATPPGRFKIVSYNLDGFRSAKDKKCMTYVEAEDADVVCFQETKINDDAIPMMLSSKYPHTYWSCCKVKKGYSGTAILSKQKLVSVAYGIGIKEHDEEGRTITAEFPSFYLVNCYVPNSGMKLERLAYRATWDEALRNYLTGLDKKKPVILAGDLNVAHTEIDLSNPKTNKRSPGFTQQERDDFTKLLSLGFVDSFRALNPDKSGHFSFWGKKYNARAKNLGWRLDYFVASQRFMEKVENNEIRTEVWGASDHVPNVLTLKDL